MSTVIWQYRITNKVVRKMRLRSFSHLKCRYDNSIYLGVRWSWRWKVEGQYRQAKVDLE